MTKFSIITVTYNASSYIDRTAASIISQKNKNWEWIIVDGASSDDTVLKLQKYNTYISKIVSEKDNGVFDAMNKGIKLASGQFVIFMNAGDEFFSEDTLTQIFNQIKPDTVLAYGNTLVKDSINHPYPIESLKFGGIMSCHQSMVFNKNKLGKRLYYRTDLFRLYLEYDLVARIVKSELKLQVLDIVVSKFLGGGISSKTNNHARKAKYYFVYEHFGITGVIASILQRIGVISHPPKKYTKINH